MKRLNLKGNDARLLDSPVEPTKIVDKLFEIQAQIESNATRKPASLKKATKFVNSFAAFADKTSSMVMVLLPQSPEYTVTFGMLFLLFKVRHVSRIRQVTLLSH